MPRRLTKKERLFARKVAKGANLTEAAEQVYDTRNPAKMGSMTAKRPKVKDLIKQEEVRLEKALNKKITNSRIVNKYSDLMEAERPDGSVDAPTQLKTLDQIHKLRGDYAPDRSITVHADGKDFLDQLTQDAQEE